MELNDLLPDECRTGTCFCGDKPNECPHGDFENALIERLDILTQKLQDLVNGQNQLLGFLAGVNDRLMTNPLLRFGRKHG